MKPVSQCVQSLLTAGQPDGSIIIHKVNIDPNPPKQGAALTVTARITLSKLRERERERENGQGFRL